MRNPTYIGYMAVGAVSLGGLFTFHAAAPFVLMGLAGLTPEQYGWSMSITVAAYLAGGFAGEPAGRAAGAGPADIRRAPFCCSPGRR